VIAMSELLEFNINHYVFVQLTDTGKQILKHHHDELNRFSNGFLGEFKPVEEDADGWSKWQMWDLMAKLGKGCRNGSKPPFFTTIKLDLKTP